MCGIFGWLLPNAVRQDRDLLRRCTSLMTHRGPDGEGYWQGETADEKYQIAFGHRRLSIIDIAGGIQPMWTADGSVGVTFNGEIYNYVELRDELRSLGHAFKTTSDTEVLLEAYRAWGLAAIGRFRGMFAFALFDKRTQRLIIARDPFGKKPLFLGDFQDGFLFSSEINPIIKFSGFDRTIDADALGHYLLNRYVPGPFTFFQRIKKLQPGCYAVWQNGTFEITRYFTAPFSFTKPDIYRFNEAVEMFERVFEDAVRIRMRSDAPFGAYLSGGIDSAAVVATMVKHHRTRVRTFSVGFDESRYSELGDARTVARLFDTDHHELVVSPSEFMQHWPMAVSHRGAPVSEASDIPILMLSRTASRTVKMVLTGEGSDELLGGYPKHRAEPWIQVYHQLVPKPLHDNLVGPTISTLPYAMRRLKVLSTAAGERELVDRMRIWFGGMSASEKNTLLGRPTQLTIPDAYPFSMKSGSNMRRTLFFDQTSWLPDNLLERGDRMMMAGSIEGRMPFMDTALALLVARFPDRFLIGRRGGKAVLRAAMGKVLPADVLHRKKIGFRVPFNEWFRGPYRSFMSDMLTGDESRVAGIFDARILRKLVQEHVAGRHNHERVLWSLTNLELFIRTFRPAGLESLRFAA